MPLLTLPPELLLEVASTLDASAISSLVLTCRSLNQLLTQTLYTLPLRRHGLAASYGPGALISAATRRDIPTVEKMLNWGILQHFGWRSRRELDLWLFCTQEAAMIQTLLVCGMDPETPFEDDPRPLLCKAAGARNPPSVKALLAAPGIQVNARDPLYDGETVLMVALRNESLDVVEVLIRDERTDVNLRDGFYGRTALHYAVDSKSLMMVKCLLQRSGIEVDVKSSNGETPLCMAVGKGDVDMTRLLLEEGRADVTLAGCVSMTRRPLHFTVLRRYLKVVQVLADFMEVQVDPENGVSDTPLGHAISHRHRRVARVLKDFGAHDEKDDKRNYFWRKVIAGKRFICFA